MRELHGWHERGDHGRHARDAHAPADGHPARTYDGPRHAAHDSLKLRMLLDPEARKAARLDYQKKVDAAQAEYAARHARPKPGDRGGDQGLGAERPGPQEPKPEHAPPETRDKPASRITERAKTTERQEQKQRKPERSRLPANDTTQMVAGIGIAVSSFADALNILPGKWDAVAASLLGAVVASVAWGNRRWKDKHGNRPED